MARKRSRAVVYGGAGGGVLVLALLGYVLTASPAASLDESRLAVVERGDLARSVVATGKVEPVSKVEIKSKANGIIEALHVEAGDLVTIGQVLAELDKDNLQARLREARAALAGAEANLSAAEAELVKNRVEAQGPEVPFARRAVDRAEQLVTEKLIPQENLDEVRSRLDQALNRQEAAKLQLGVSAARVAQAGAAVSQARAAAERAQEELANATIRSPIHGMVLSRDVEIGSPVSSILNLGANATPVMVLGDVSQVYVKGRVDETDIGQVRLDQPARITVETFKGRAFAGRVTRLAPMGSERDNVVSFEVRVSIDNGTGELRPNMTANAEIVLEEHKGTLIIPEAAVVYDQARATFADVHAPGTETGRRRVPITVGVSNGTRTQVVDGLSEGQKVVLQ